MENKFKVLNQIEFNGVQYPFAVSVWGLEQLESVTGKDLVELSTSNSITVTKKKLEFGIISGLKNLKKNDQVKDITDELIDEMLIGIDGLMGDVIYTYSIAFGKFYNVQAEGN